MYHIKFKKMLTSLAYLFLSGLSLGYIFKKFRLPALMGMLITGIVLGPSVLNLISSPLLGISVELRQGALVIILMRAGLALDIKELKKVGRPAILMCFIPACFEIAGMILIAPKLLGISVLEAAIMGTVIAAVSPAIIVPKMLYLMEKKIGTKKGIPQMIMAAGSVDDVFVIVIFSVFIMLATGGDVSVNSFVQIPVSIITGLFFGIVAGWGLVKFFKKCHMRDTILKFYPVLANRISPKFSKLWIAAEIIFFVMVGATVDIKFATATGLAAVVVIFFALVFRMCGVFICMLKSKLNVKERLFCMIAYTPKATVQAAIGSLPLAMGLSVCKLLMG